MNPSDTIVLVMVVPTLAPMMMGIALSIVIDPEATNATTNAVVVELLWIMAVISRPMNNPVNGLEVARMMVSAADLPKCCRDDTIRSSANTKSISVPMMYNTLRMLLQCGGDVIGVAGSNAVKK
jgi:hypothetical protein